MLTEEEEEEEAMCPHLSHNPQLLLTISTSSSDVIDKPKLPQFFSHLFLPFPNNLYCWD